MNVTQVGEEQKIAGAAPDLNGKILQYRGTGISFGDLLKEKVVPQELKFSAHAESRIKSRGIKIDTELKQKIDEAVKNVASKGGRDALIFSQTNAFIVNIASKTVITAIDGEGLKDNVFTNIDSAAVI